MFLNILTPDIILAIITLVSTVAVAWIKKAETVKIKKLELKINQLQEEKNEIQLSSGSLDIIMDLKFLNIIRDKVDDIFKMTTADSFLIYFSINGTSSFNFITAIYEQHKEIPETKISMGAINKYVNIQIDDHYRQMLKEVELLGDMSIEYDRMPDCLLKKYYTIEGIKYSIIKFLKRLRKDEKNDVVIFCSIAKHTDNPFSDIEKVIIKTNIDVIRNAANNLNVNQKI
jgi:hypothetical protein